MTTMYQRGPWVGKAPRLDALQSHIDTCPVCLAFHATEQPVMRVKEG